MKQFCWCHNFLHPSGNFCNLQNTKVNSLGPDQTRQNYYIDFDTNISKAKVEIYGSQLVTTCHLLTAFANILNPEVRT